MIDNRRVAESHMIWTILQDLLAIFAIEVEEAFVLFSVQRWRYYCWLETILVQYQLHFLLQQF